MLRQYSEEGEKDYIYEKYLPLERALQEISDTRYDRQAYNCVDFTEDLQEELNKLNIATVMINGKTPNDRIGKSHRWIAVQFEPITGDFVKVSDKYIPKWIVE